MKPSIKDLDNQQSYLIGKLDMLDHLISSVRGTGSRRFLTQLAGLRRAVAEHLTVVTGELCAARQAAAR